ncbi:MAG: aldose 1-epimerase family protein [Bacteroidetes bacterium]|nr:aldose 1-epimerase family protein [Bacteroidota bacterium]
MAIELISPLLKIKINQKGAELCSVTNNDGVEYIWQANADIWPRHAPVLFPIVGKLKDDELNHENKSYTLTQHGFARDMNFELVASELNFCTFQLQSNEHTRSKFPFDFIFEVRFDLENSTLKTSYKVYNPSKETLRFSLGAHPGFNCPLLPEESMQDYYLEFESDNYKQTLLHNGLLSDEKLNLNLKDNKLPLSPSVFDKDAMVFENNQINKISLCSKTSAHKIIMECENWPYFGIWSKKGCDKFVCLEPWFGIADNINSTKKFSDKNGLIHLSGGEEFKASFSTAFYQ